MKSVYNELLLELANEAKRSPPLPHPSHQSRVVNPLCGDDVTVALSIGATRTIDGVGLSGSGCVISQASAGALQSAVVGKRLEDLGEVIRAARAFLKEGTVPSSPELGDALAPLAEVRRLPTRLRCALIAWEALEKAAAEAD